MIRSPDMEGAVADAGRAGQETLSVVAVSFQEGLWKANRTNTPISQLIRQAT